MNKLKTIFVAVATLFITTNINAQSKNIFYVDQLKNKITQLVDTFPAEVGVAFSIEGETFETHNNLHFPVMDVAKFYQAIAICNKLNNNNLSVFNTVQISDSDLDENTWSPMLEVCQAGDKISIDKLLEYSLVQGDNNASDILFGKVADIEYTDNFINSIAKDACFLETDQKTLHRDNVLCYDNWTNPVSAVKILEYFYKNHRKDNYKYVWNFMAKSTIGENRIPKYIKDYATIIHGTGTGIFTQNGKTDIVAVNDVACVVLPNGRYFCLAVFVKDAQCSVSRCEELIATIAQKCFEYFD